VRTVGTRNLVQGITRLAQAHSLGQPIFGLFVVLGLLGAALSRDQVRPLAMPMACCAVAVLGIAFAFPFQVRLFTLALPWLCIAAGAGVVRFGRSLRLTSGAAGLGRWVSRVGAAVVTGALVVTLITVSARSVGEMEGFTEAWIPERQEQRAAGETLRLPLGRLRVVDADPTVAYYSGAMFRFWPLADSLTAIRYLRTISPDYIVLRPRTIHWPYVQAWYENGPPSDLAQPAFAIGDTRVYVWLGQEDAGETDSIPPP
jgi:hypothetical protein